MAFTILIVDDEWEVCLSLAEVLQSKGYMTLHEDDPLKVLALLGQENVDLILMDVRMPALGGIDLLKILRKTHPLLPVIMISGYASVESAVRAMKYGALNFFAKPVQLSELFQEIHHLERSVRIKRPVMTSTDTIVTANEKVGEVLSLVQKAAPTEASVIIIGESGTGKELIADLLHHASKRKNNAYIKVNCAAIPDNLLESEMFGHEKGAFTDAQSQQKGKIELADGGTIFFDEIGDMSLQTQSKMLRVLQEKHFTRLGGSVPIQADFRIIAATNKSIESMIAQGSFREDLFYRLSVITLKLPPLRERGEDIVPLALHFIGVFNQVYGKNVLGISEKVIETLEGHSWPGNVRELKNIIERAVIFCETDLIEPRDLPEQYRIVDRSAAGFEAIKEFSTEKARAVIREALRQTNGIKGEAARLLKITRKTLYNRMKRLNLE
ncbi:MAG: sigma-54 dependent transcriptional regulator [Spirochaetia bacterium]|jgi:DNA-binding NtrC family response regulator